jgi:hypothetical protein
MVGLVILLTMILGTSNALALDETGCLACHQNTDLTTFNDRGIKVSLYVNQSSLAASAHRYIDCTKCHGEKPHEKGSPLTKASLAEKCGTCHEYQYRQHRESIHGQQLLAGNPDVATCVDCHSEDQTPHSVIRVLSYEAPAYRKNIAQTCGRCHGDEDLMARYGILEKIYESYMRSFHGKAMQLAPNEIGQLNKATCTNCHGVHDIKHTKDPASPVGGLASLAETCEQCHQGAGENFASGFLGHKEASLQEFPEVFVTERFFLALTTGVLAFGFATVALDLIRWLFSRRGRRHPGEGL